MPSYNPGYPAGGHRHTIPAGYGAPVGGGPLIITGGGSSGKKGRQNLAVLGGYGLGGAGGPLFLQAGGGGGKKGRQSVTIIGGYGQPAVPQFPMYTGWAGEHLGHQFYGPSMPIPMPTPMPTPMPPSYFNPGYPAGGHRHSLPGGFGGSPVGGPLIITGGGSSGKKGRQNLTVLGGYGLGGAGGPLFLQAGGGGGKKGRQNVTIIGGYGQPAMPQFPMYTGWAGEHLGHHFQGPSMPIPMPTPMPPYGGDPYPANPGGGWGGFPGPVDDGGSDPGNGGAGDPAFGGKWW